MALVLVDEDGFPRIDVEEFNNGLTAIVHLGYDKDTCRNVFADVSLTPGRYGDAILNSSGN
jgi:hypothetical protein